MHMITAEEGSNKKKKRQRFEGGGSSSSSNDNSNGRIRISTSSSSSFPDATATVESLQLHHPLSLLLRSVPGGFNDSLTSDVLLHLHLDSHSLVLHPSHSPIDLHLHSDVLRRRSKYFSALLSDRWHTKPPPDSAASDDPIIHLNLKIPPSSSSPLHPHLTVLQLLYSDDFSDTIVSAAVALSVLPVALELLFDDCIHACVQFLEAVPWSDDEENAVLSIIPLLGQDESQELLARLSPPGPDSSEEMLHRLLMASIGNHPNVASVKVKAFVGKMLRDFPSREPVRRVFDRAFKTSLRTVKESLEKYSSPDFRGDHDETEAIQRLNLHSTVYHGKDLLWLVERMIELRIADTAAEEWSEQTAFVADLQRAFQDDAWRNIAPGLPALVLRCTGRLADAVAAGSILAARQVRLKLVRVWLPVLVVCREKNVSPIPSPSGQKQLFQELEETFLRIISTLPMLDAELLLHHCLSFATRNVEDCPHLVSAFNTWFRRATRLPHDDNAS